MKIWILSKRAVAAGLAVLCLFLGICVWRVIDVQGQDESIQASALGKLKPIYSVDTAEKKAAITFNAAWGNSDIPQLLQTLEKENVKATFFILGDFAKEFPESVKQISDAGHEIANHSNRHPHVATIGGQQVGEDLKACEEKLEQITGKKPSLYRAPYGEYSDEMLQAVKGQGYRCIQWDIDSIDWKDPPADQIVQKVLDKIQNGSIVLFHTDKQNTAEALPTIISGIKQKGLELVTVSELLYPGDDTDANGIQHKPLANT